MSSTPVASIDSSRARSRFMPPTDVLDVPVLMPCSGECGWSAPTATSSSRRSRICSELGIKPVTLYRYRRAAGRVARAGREGHRLLNRESQATSPAAEHVLNLSVGFRPLPQTTRSILNPLFDTLPKQPVDFTACLEQPKGQVEPLPATIDQAAAVARVSPRRLRDHAVSRPQPTTHAVLDEPGAVLGLAPLPLGPARLDDHRLQGAPRAAVDGPDRAGPPAPCSAPPAGSCPRTGAGPARPGRRPTRASSGAGRRSRPRAGRRSRPRAGRRGAGDREAQASLDPVGGHSRVGRG